MLMIPLKFLLTAQWIIYVFHGTLDLYHNYLFCTFARHDNRLNEKSTSFSRVTNCHVVNFLNKPRAFTACHSRVAEFNERFENVWEVSFLLPSYANSFIRLLSSKQIFLIVQQATSFWRVIYFVSGSVFLSEKKLARCIWWKSFFRIVKNFGHS